MASSAGSVEPYADPGQRSGGSVFHRLYTGAGAFNIVGLRKRFYIGFGLLILICALSMGIRGFNFGIDFKGGTEIQMPAVGVHGTITVSQAKQAFADALGHQPDSVVSAGTGRSASIQIHTQTLSKDDAVKVESALFQRLQPLDTNGKPSQTSISDSTVSASWGGEISRQALIALGVFLVLVTIFLTAYFERWMAMAAIVALINDLVVTAGVYSLVGLEVSPPTVIGLLTILGFSLYDTVVVFDKVKENARGLLSLARRTYAEAANLALNQTLMRSINTSLIGLLPVIGLLVVGVGVLGVGTLTDLALVQMVGMLSGALSSIFLATPLLVDFKMRQQPYRQQAAKVMARRAKRSSAADAGGTAGGPGEEDIEADLRRERALAAASSVPARTAKKSGAHRAQPAGRPARPSGKRRR